MTVPPVIQPNIQLGILDQTNIALNLFSTILRTANTREELERSWAAIEQDITTQEQLEARRGNAEIFISFPYRGDLLKSSLSYITILFRCLDTVL
jgi:hypothetical protein